MKNEDFVKAIGVSLVISLLAGMVEYLFSIIDGMTMLRYILGHSVCFPDIESVSKTVVNCFYPTLLSAMTIELAFHRPKYAKMMITVFAAAGFTFMVTLVTDNVIVDCIAACMAFLYCYLCFRFLFKRKTRSEENEEN